MNDEFPAPPAFTGRAVHRRDPSMRVVFARDEIEPRVVHYWDGYAFHESSLDWFVHNLEIVQAPEKANV